MDAVKYITEVLEVVLGPEDIKILRSGKNTHEAMAILYEALIHAYQKPLAIASTEKILHRRMVMRLEEQFWSFSPHSDKGIRNYINKHLKDSYTIELSRTPKRHLYIQMLR